jgi:hypothetical protein
MKFITFENGAIIDGMPITPMSKAMDKVSKNLPGATVEDLPGPVCLYWPKSVGPGVAIIERDGYQSTHKIPSHDPFFLPPDSVVRLKPKTGAGLTLSVAISGAYVVAQGHDADIALPLMPQPGDSPLKVAGLNWLRTGRVGASSYTLCVALTGAIDPQRKDEHDNPWDPSDFGRCDTFFKVVPEARAKIAEMSSISPQWAALAPIWDELETIYNEDKALGKSPRLYERMKSVLDPVRNRPRSPGR